MMKVLLTLLAILISIHSFSQDEGKSYELFNKERKLLADPSIKISTSDYRTWKLLEDSINTIVKQKLKNHLMFVENGLNYKLILQIRFSQADGMKYDTCYYSLSTPYKPMVKYFFQANESFLNSLDLFLSRHILNGKSFHFFLPLSLTSEIPQRQRMYSTQDPDTVQLLNGWFVSKAVYVNVKRGTSFR